VREREILENKYEEGEEQFRVRENLQKYGRWEWERKRGREGELEGEDSKQYKFKGVKDANELCVKWTLPSEKLLLIKLTCVILLEGRADSFPSMHSSM
jgi:hypothetical protein